MGRLGENRVEVRSFTGASGNQESWFGCFKYESSLSVSDIGRAVEFREGAHR